MIGAPPGRPPTLADLITTLQTQQTSLQQLVNLLPGLIHQKAVPLKIYGLAASGSQNKIIVGSYQARRIVNIQLDSSQLYSGGQKLREIWSGFDTDQPFIANMSTVNVTIAFDEGADPTNEVITIPPNYVWWNGILSPAAFSSGVAGSFNFLADNADGQAVTTTAQDLLTLARLQGFNGATWDRLRVEGAGVGNLRTGIWAGTAQAGVNNINSDALFASALGLDVSTLSLGFNGTNWDRVRTLFNQGAGLGVLQASPPQGQVLASAAGTGAAVTATAAGPGVGIANWITGILAICAATGAAPGAATFDITTTGLPTNQLTIPVGVSAVAGQEFDQIYIPFANPLKGAANGAITVTGTPPANVRLGLAIIGFTA